MTDILQLAFFRNALWAICIISVASAIVGTYIVTRRFVSLSGGVTHACFGGLGLGYWMGINPLIMAGIFAVGSALGVEWMGHRGKVRDDSAIALMWALGMAVGTIFVFLTPGYVPELNAFLFGNILTVTTSDLWIFGAFTALLIAFVAFRFRHIVICAFDSDFASVIHLPAKTINTVMIVLTALCIVLTIRMAGIMLLMSMLVLPQLIAELYFSRYLSIMIASAAVSLGCCVSGLFLGILVDVPCSALIVMVSVGAYIICALSKRLTCRNKRC